MYKENVDTSNSIKSTPVKSKETPSKLWRRSINSQKKNATPIKVMRLDLTEERVSFENNKIEKK